MIECGRYHNISPSGEYISFVNQTKYKMKNTPYSLISCDAYGYDNIRQDFLTVLSNNTYQREQNLSFDILKSTEKETILKLTKFVFSCFELSLRDKRFETTDAENTKVQYYRI